MENQFVHPESEKHVPTAAGVVIIVLVAIIAGLVFWKYESDMDSVAVAPVVTAPVQIKKAPEAAREVPAAVDQPAESDTPIDFDKEIKNMDADISAVDSGDFGDAGLSNANLGL